MINKQRNTTVLKDCAPGTSYTAVEPRGLAMSLPGEYLHNGVWMNN